jgi:hypothetical protein
MKTFFTNLVFGQMTVILDGKMIIGKNENMKLEIGQKPPAERLLTKKLLSKDNTSKRN